MQTQDKLLLHRALTILRSVNRLSRQSVIAGYGENELFVEERNGKLFTIERVSRHAAALVDEQGREWTFAV